MYEDTFKLSSQRVNAGLTIKYEFSNDFEVIIDKIIYHSYHYAEEKEISENTFFRILDNLKIENRFIRKMFIKYDEYMINNIDRG